MPSIQRCVTHGVDTFDSCFPTRVARHGTLLTRAGRLHIDSGKYRRDFGPIDPEVKTIDCSRAYLHHLAKMKEPLYDTLASLHNVMHMNALMVDMRRRIYADEI